MSEQESATAELLDLASRGDKAARGQLFTQHRHRLRQMVAFHMDRRLATRVDPSDVVQEAFTDAAQRLSDYLRRRPLPFYPWLRQLAWERLLDLHRRHIIAQKRSIQREEAPSLLLPDESALELADRLVAQGSSPIGQLLRKEQRERIRDALTLLGPRDQEVLVLRHLEQLSISETAAVMSVSEGVVKTRHLRALQRFRDLLLAEGEGQS